MAQDVVVTNDQASAFYRHFGFVPFPDQPMRLAMSVATAKASVYVFD
jgi:hypothetical protein